MSVITISKGVSRDAVALAQIKLRVWLETYVNSEHGVTEADVYAKDFLCKERVAKRAEHMQADDGINYTLVARDGAQIVGYGRAVKGGRSNEIVTLYILPEWQGQGIGSMLLRQLLTWYDDGQDVLVEVVTYNSKAIRFYEKLGFKRGKLLPHGTYVMPSGADLPVVAMTRAV